jgi:hypothetical protein
MLMTVQRQPSWISRAAFGAAVFMFGGVMLVLVVPAALAAALVLLVLAAGRSTGRYVRPALRLERTGRRNVRVITRH